MANCYKHRQKGYLWLCVVIPFFVIIGSFVPTFIVAAERSHSALGDVFMQGGLWVVLIMLPVLVWAGLFLSSLTVWIDDRAVRIRFGFGMWKKTFVLDQIQSAAAVRNHWIDGWGIHYFGNGWLYNIAGMDAVELTFKDGKKARIGTDEPDKLAAAIQAALEEKSGV